MWFNNPRDMEGLNGCVKIFNGYANIDCNIFLNIKACKRTRGHVLTLVKEQSILLYVGKY